jgi:hypothetical protein
MRLEDVRRALDARDPSLVDMIVALANEPDPYPEDAPDDAMTIHKLRAQLNAWDFQWKSPEERMHIRVEGWKKLEADDAPVPLPERLKVWQVIEELHAAEGAYAREVLLDVIRTAPIKWGVWRGLKRLFKEAETSGDLELFGALVARVDSELSRTYGNWGEVTRRTLSYMARRGWRWLRNRGQQFPAAYINAACAVLREYPDHTNWSRTWVANHIIFHDYDYYGGKAYGQAGFRFWSLPDSFTENRAYSDLWRERPEPLFALLERARSEHVRRFAIEGLKADFRAEIRELGVDTIARLIRVDSGTVHEFAVWLLENAPRFEQTAFKDLGLHDPVLSLLDSPSGTARAYAAKYVRTHARDLPLDDLIRLANHSDATVRKVVNELLSDRDPRKDIGLEAWGQLLGTYHAHDLAVRNLTDHFGASELTLKWFRDRFLSPQHKVVQFAIDRFGDVHAADSAGADYFVDLLETVDVPHATVQFAGKSLGSLDISAIDIEVLRRLVLHSSANAFVLQWVDEDRIEPASFGVDYWRALAFLPTWESWEWAQKLITDGPKFYETYGWNDAYVAERARGYLRDVRNFTPTEIGVDWLLEVVAHNDESGREWARDYMFEAFALAEFASDATDDGGGDADLGGKSFLFTGKLASMTRKEAQGKVTDAGGTNAKSVTKNLDYLVIGDDGSPLFGLGERSSKHRKADSLVESGESINIISETAFLQMLAGGRKTYGEAEMIAGSERLWEMATGPDASDGPIETFARSYLLRHHEVIGKELTDKTVEAERAIPQTFLTLDRVGAAMLDERYLVRNFALRIARQEMARWSPSLTTIQEYSEARRPEVRQLFADALLADDTKENRRLRIDPASLDPTAIYPFLESLDRGTRELGMAVIDAYPSFAHPESLFGLTDSPDREVRAFVVKTIWRLYRDRGTTDGWAPRERSEKYLERADARFETGPGVTPRPDAMPATAAALRDFLRRVLFGIPPGRLPKGTTRSDDAPKPLPAGREKLFLLETMRDLALEDEAFAGVLTPLLQEFVRTLGKAERGASLVALARIDEQWPGSQAMAI